MDASSNEAYSIAEMLSSGGKEVQLWGGRLVDRIACEDTTRNTAMTNDESTIEMIVLCAAIIIMSLVDSP